MKRGFDNKSSPDVNVAGAGYAARRNPSDREKSIRLRKNFVRMLF